MDEAVASSHCKPGVVVNTQVPKAAQHNVVISEVVTIQRSILRFFFIVAGLVVICLTKIKMPRL